MGNQTLTAQMVPPHGRGQSNHNNSLSGKPAEIDHTGNQGLTGEPVNTPRPNTGQHVDPAHKAACRSLGYALTRDSVEGWAAHEAMLAARLTPEERAWNAWSALQALGYRHALDVAAASLDCAPNFPPPSFVNPMHHARFWVGHATRDERKAYMLACYEASSPEDQAAFLAYVQRGAAA